MPSWRDRASKHLTWKDKLMSGFQHPDKQAEYLKERAAANEAAEKAKQAAEAEARRKGAKARKGLY